jgi:hypothetical protein
MEHIELVLAEDSVHGKKGQRVNLALHPSDVHDPTEMPTYLAGYSPFAYRGDEASPVVLVDKDTDKHRDFSSDDTFRRIDVKGADDSNVPEVDPSSALTQYTVVNRYIGSFIPQQTESNAGANYQPRRVAGRKCKNALYLDREIDVWTLLGTNTNWASANRVALGATEYWNGGSTGDPIKAIHTLMEAASQPVTGLWANQKVMNTFIRHDKVKDHMRQFFGDAAVASIAGAIATASESGAMPVDFAIPGLPPFHVAAAKVKSESTGALGYILGDVMVGTHSPPGIPQDAEDIASSYTFRRRGPSGVGFEVREFRVEGRGPLGGTMLVVSMADVAQFISNTAGGIITAIIG